MRRRRGDKSDTRSSSEAWNVYKGQDAAKGLRSGTFAELIRHVMLMPEDERAQYCIEKAGDREYHVAEVAGLSQRPDFPAG